VTGSSSHPAAAQLDRRRAVVVLASGAGTLLQALLDDASDLAAPYRVAGLVSDRPDAAALQRARDAGVATAVVQPAEFADRATWDRALTRTVEAFHPRLVVLAGFMRLLGPAFLAGFGGRTLNCHPALLPAFPGAHAVRDALAYGVKVTGASVILVDDGVDSGPVVAQRAVPVEDGDDEATLHERIKVTERRLLVETVRALGAGWTVTGRAVHLTSHLDPTPSHREASS
jgi:phosphoribosylglycinamide formyltransferase 1